MLDFRVKPLKDWKDRAFDVLLSFEMGISNSLRVGSNVFEEPRDAPQALVEMLPLLQGMRDGLGWKLALIILIPVLISLRQ